MLKRLVIAVALVLSPALLFAQKVPFQQCLVLVQRAASNDSEFVRTAEGFAQIIH